MVDSLSMFVLGFLSAVFIIGLFWQYRIDAATHAAYERGVADRATAEAAAWHSGYIEGWRDARLARFGREARPDDVVVRSN